MDYIYIELFCTHFCSTNWLKHQCFKSLLFWVSMWGSVIRNSIFHFDKKKQFLPAKKSKKHWIFCKFDKKKYNSIHTLNCKGKNNNSQQQRNPKFLFLSTFRRNFWRIIFIIIIILLKKKNFKKYISYAATLLPTKFFVISILY